MNAILESTNALFCLPPAGEVHIWQVDLDRTPASAYREILSADEKDRAARFHASRNRSRFVAAHGALRQILSRYLAVEPASLVFTAGEFGKPHLPGNSLHFNLSHSGPLLLIAIAPEEVGIDIEQIRDDLEFAEIIEAYFEPEETAEIHALAAENRARRFFELWTEKEASCKARGVGIAYGLEAVDPQFHSWPAKQIAVPNGFVAALAMQHVHWTPRICEWK